jgi:hypothetical protein
MQSVQDSATQGEMWVLDLAGQCGGDSLTAAMPDMVRWLVCAMEDVPPADACFRE